MAEETFGTESYIRFTYPFRFDLMDFNSHCRQLDQAEWQGRDSTIKVWKPGKFANEELLSYVSDFLNPTDDNKATAKLWDLDKEKALSSLQGGLGVNKNVSWELHLKKSHIRFQIMDVRIILFQIGVGFLIFEIKLISPGCLLSDWLDFVHNFRFTSGSRARKISCKAKKGIDSETKEPIIEPFFPQPCGGTATHPDGFGEFYEVLEGILATAALPGSVEPWHEPIYIPFLLLPFIVLFPNDVPDDRIPLRLYQSRNMFHNEEGLSATPEDLQFNQATLLPNAPFQWFFFSLDGGGYIAFDVARRIDERNLPFFQENLPDHLRKNYFLLFILALQQRFALMILLDKVADNIPLNPTHHGPLSYLPKREEHFDQIRDQLMIFTARGYFAQVMHREHLHRCYKKWQEIFQIERLYEEVSNEIHYISDHYQSMHERSLNRIAWIIGIPALGLTFLQTLNLGDWRVSVLTLLLGIPLGYFLYRQFSRLHLK